jgi:CcmD family protein
VPPWTACISLWMTNPMRLLGYLLVVLAFVTTCESGVLLAAQPPAMPPPQDEFVPIDQLPPQDQLPAAPLLVIAYIIVLAVLFAYLISLARRMSAIQREVRQLESSLGRSRRE